MPIVAVIGAIAAWAVPGIGAAVGAIAAGTLPTLLGAFELIGAVGATLGAIGQVVHDKTLSTIGLVMGGIGGIGALATNVGLFGAEAAAGTTDMLGNVIKGVGQAGKTGALAGVTAAGANAASDFSGLAGQTAGADPFDTLANIGGLTNANSFVTSTGGLAPGETMQSVSTMSNKVGTGLVNAGTSTTAKPLDPTKTVTGDTPPTKTTADVSIPPVKTVDTPPVAGSNITGAPQGLKPDGTAWQIGDTRTASDGTVMRWMGGSTWTEVPGFFKGILGNSKLMEAGLSFISGATDSTKPAQVANYMSQANFNNAQADILKKQLANMNQPGPVAHRVAAAPVTGAPAPTGMINTPPPGPGAVTGAPVT